MADGSPTYCSRTWCFDRSRLCCEPCFPDVVYKPLRSRQRTSVDIGTRHDFGSAVVEVFLL